MNFAYWILRYVTIGPLLRIVFRIKVRGLNNIPREGGVILAANHQAVIDSFVIMGLAHRAITFLAKSEYFTDTGLRGWMKKKFFSIGAVPVYRDDKNAGTAVADMSVKVLKAGGMIAIHPEGTRAPTADVYRFKTGVIDVAWRSEAPVVPIALIGTRNAIPTGRKLPRFGARITVVIGEPMYFEQPHVPQAMERAAASTARRLQALKLMKEIAELGGLNCVNADARKVKEAMLR